MGADDKHGGAGDDLLTPFDPEQSMEMPINIGQIQKSQKEKLTETGQIWLDDFEGLPEAQDAGSEAPPPTSDWQSPDPTPPADAAPTPVVNLEKNPHQTKAKAPKSAPQSAIPASRSTVQTLLAAVAALIVLFLFGGAFAFLSEPEGPTAASTSAEAERLLEAGDDVGAMAQYEKFITFSDDAAEIAQVRHKLIQWYVAEKKLGQAIAHAHILGQGAEPKIDDLKLLAQLYYASNRMAEGARTLGRVARHPSASLDDQHLGIQALGDGGKFDAAKAIVEKISNPSAKIGAGMRLHTQLGDYQAAQALYDGADATLQEKYEVLAALGDLTQARGAWEAAEQQFRSARQADASALLPMIEHAQAMAQIGALDKAEDLLSRLATQNPDSGFVQLAWAEFLLEKARRTLNQENDDGQKACAAAEAALERTPRVKRCYALATWASGDIGGASTALEALLEEAPGMPELTLDVAALQLRQNDAPGALQTFHEGLQLMPGRYDFLAAKGRIHLDLDQVFEAEAAFNQILSRQKDHAPARLGIAEIAIRDRYFNRARAMISKVIEEHPKDVEGYFAMADLNLALGKTRPAIAQYKKVLEFQPDNVSALLSLASLQARKNNFDGILYWLDKAFAAGATPARVVNNPIFSPLVGEPEYEALVKKYAR